MKVRDIMRWNPTVVTPEEAVSHAAEHMRYEHDACIPVVKDKTTRELAGVITARDLATRCLARRHGPDCTVGDHMTPMPLLTVQPRRRHQRPAGHDACSGSTATAGRFGRRSAPRRRDRIRGHRCPRHQWLAGTFAVENAQRDAARAVSS